MAIALSFAKHEYSVFTEQGDISKIDLIAEKDGKLFRIQCKAVTPNDGKLSVELRKRSTHYEYIYQKEDFDYFGIVDLSTTKTYLVSSEEALQNVSIFTLRLEEPKNGRTKNIHMAEDYEFDKVITGLA